MAFVEGKRPVPTSGGDAAWRAPSYQVLLALLAQPDLLTAPVRSVAAQAGVSTSPVLQVQKKLLQSRFAVHRHDEWQWTPRGLQEARTFWLHGYHATLRPHPLVGRFRPRTALTQETMERNVDAALRGRYLMRWGGAAAAHRLDSYYRGDRTVVHVDGAATPSSLAPILRMLPDPDGPLVVLRIPGPCALNAPDPTTVHPLLAWAELLEEGHDRASEAAERFASAFLKEP